MEKVTADVERALADLGSAVACEVEDTPSHRVVVASNLEGQDCVDAAAIYLVALRARMLSAVLTYEEVLLDTEEERAELLDDLSFLLDSPAPPASEDYLRRMRNPWLAEGITHLLLNLSRQNPGLHPCGTVLAVTHAHVRATDHGTDCVALFEEEDGAMGVTIVETKAYGSGGSSALSAACQFFEGFDAGAARDRVRDAVQLLRLAVPSGRQADFSPSLWRSNRAYSIDVHYPEGSGFPATEVSDRLGRLAPPATRILLCPHPLADFEDFFERLSTAMTAYAEGL